MALAVNDILQITDVQNYLSQAVLNVYFYRVVSLESLTDYNDIQGSFKTAIIDAVRDMQSDQLTHTRIVIKNLTNGLDIHEEPYALVGNNNSDPLPTTNALAFRLVRSTALTRHGSKRIAGLTDIMTSGNEITAAHVATVGLIASAMGAPIDAVGTVDHDFEIVPVIVGRFPQGSPNEGELDLSKINPVSGAQYIRLTTQTTRRAGRGI